MRTSLAPRELAFQKLRDVSESIRLRKISPVNVVTACLDRIERLQPRLNAFITVTAEAAVRAAKTAEKEIEDGRWKGPLHGIPVGLKDFYDTAGVRTTAASDRFRERVPLENAASVEKLERAGAIAIGKTNMHTLGMGTTGLDSSFGPVTNPWNADHIPGGSSSGSAVAIAAGLCYATLDTDAIGSCRLPAACCGVVGYKASYGAIDLSGILAGEPPPDATIQWLSHAGVTTRSIQDTALVLDVLAERKDGATWREVLPAERALRVVVANNVAVDKERSSVFDKAVATLRSLGHVVSDAEAPLTDFGKGIAHIEADRREIAHLVFNDIDALILPTTTGMPPTVKSAAKHPQALSPELTMFANYYGLPAVSVPCGFDGHGLPVGLQIVAAPANDDVVLQLAYQYEQAVEFADRHPIV